MPAGYEVIETYNMQGFKTHMTVPIGWSTMVKSYNMQGSLIMPTPTIPPSGNRETVAAAQAAVTTRATVLQQAATETYLPDNAAPSSRVAWGYSLVCVLLGVALGL